MADNRSPPDPADRLSLPRPNMSAAIAQASSSFGVGPPPAVRLAPLPSWAVPHGQPVEVSATMVASSSIFLEWHGGWCGEGGRI